MPVPTVRSHTTPDTCLVSPIQGRSFGKSGVITRRASSRGAVSVRGFRGPVSVEIEEIAKRFAFVLDEMVGFHQRVWKA